MPLSHIALIGATSRVGPAILAALSSGPFDVVVLLRPTSKPLPDHQRCRVTTTTSDLPSTDELSNALAGCDALVCALHPSTLELQLRLADACVAAGVRRYVLADYGSVESDSPMAAELIPLFRHKTEVRLHCQHLTQQLGADKFSWTSLVTGHFFDYGLKSPLLGFNLRNRVVTLIDGGKTKWSCSTTGQIGKAVASILRRESETANRVLYIQSFCVSQEEVAEAVEGCMQIRLTRIEISGEESISKSVEKVRKGNLKALEDIAGVLGLQAAQWEGKEQFANNILGLEEKDMHSVVAKVCKEVSQ